jgi:RNA polymerase sigma factor (TIGR02999 family)
VPTTTSAHEIEVIELLRARRGGDESAGARLFELLYAELRAIARRRLSDERSDHTLAPTALVHEVFLRLEQSPIDCEDRREYLALAATVMRRILIDGARRRLHRESLATDGVEPRSAEAPRLELRVLALECALERLELVDPELARVVELRFLLGLDIEAAARTLGISTASVQRDWRTARAFLKRAIEADENGEASDRDGGAR